VSEVPTPHGPARVHVEPVASPRGVLVLGHGAGGGVEAPDLLAAARAGHTAGLHVVRVEQPYRVAGRRAPAPAGQLDTAWRAVLAALRTEFGELPLVTGGRSSGARVACRSADLARAVVCLAFPVHPPGKPEKHRLAELDAVAVPVLVVQGRTDAFGMPPAAAGRELVVLDGDHSLKKDPAGVERAVGAFLTRTFGGDLPADP
jgi:uncharacterized protein